MKIIKSMKNSKKVFTWNNAIRRDPKENKYVKVNADKLQQSTLKCRENKRVIAKTANNELGSQNVEELFGIDIFSTLPFENHINKVLKKVVRN